LLVLKFSEAYSGQCKWMRGLKMNRLPYKLIYGKYLENTTYKTGNENDVY
jgi:hypothetical protein